MKYESTYYREKAYKDEAGNIKSYTVDNKEYPQYSVYGLKLGEGNAKLLSELKLKDSVAINGKIITRVK